MPEYDLALNAFVAIEHYYTYFELQYSSRCIYSLNVTYDRN